MSSIGVTAASGQLGQLVLKTLAARLSGSTTKIVALVRSPEKVSADHGVEARKFDYNSPDPAQLADVKVLLLISSNEFAPPGRFAQHKNVVDAAKKAGVRSIVYTSLLNAAGSAVLLAKDHKATEEYLEESYGSSFVSLRNGWYFENYDLRMATQHGVILGATRGKPLSPATRADYAEGAAEVLVRIFRDQPVKKVYELAGSAPITLSEIAGEVSKVSGKAVHYVDLAVADYAAKLASFGLPEAFAQVLAQSDDAIAGGALLSINSDLPDLIGRPTTALATYVAAALA
jgi:NAD(P)H dehydrogenase (quinone)